MRTIDLVGKGLHEFLIGVVLRRRECRKCTLGPGEVGFSQVRADYALRLLDRDQELFLGGGALLSELNEAHREELVKIVGQVLEGVF